MHNILALVRSSWLSAASYRFRLLVSLGSLAVTMVPLYFVANAIQPVIAESIQTQGGEYFGFLLVGMISLLFLGSAVSSLPTAVSGGISSGTLEALFSTRASVPTLLAGMTGYGFLWTGVRCLVLLAAGALLGANFVWHQAMAAVGILLLIILAYLPFGIFAAALVLAFRTPGPVPRAVTTLSALLGGAYYPTQVIPSWIQDVSTFIPLTYGLRALRRVLLEEEMPLGAVITDVAILAGFAALLLALSLWAFTRALQYARRRGTLSHY